MRSAFLEAVFVVFGVVLALAANEWRQNVKAEAMADSALESIIAELQANQALVQESHDYHTQQAQMLQTKLRSGEMPTMNDFPKGFINPAWVTDTAWEVAKATGVLAEMDYQDLLDLSAAYDRLEHYTKQSDISGHHLYGIIFHEGSPSILNKPSNLMTIIYTFIYREKQVLENLENTLKNLED